MGEKTSGDPIRDVLIFRLFEQAEKTRWSQNGHEMVTTAFRAVFRQPEKIAIWEYGGYT
jgi:hypothetical protein